MGIDILGHFNLLSLGFVGYEEATVLDDFSKPEVQALVFMLFDLAMICTYFNHEQSSSELRRHISNELVWKFVDIMEGVRELTAPDPHLVHVTAKLLQTGYF